MLQKINHVAAVLIHSTVAFNPHDVVIIALSLGRLKNLKVLVIWMLLECSPF